MGSCSGVFLLCLFDAFILGLFGVNGGQSGTGDLGDGLIAVKPGRDFRRDFGVSFCFELFRFSGEKP